jgi:hypothetical protein
MHDDYDDDDDDDVILVKKPEKKRSLGSARRIWEDDIKIDLQKAGSGRGMV